MKKKLILKILTVILGSPISNAYAQATQEGVANRLPYIDKLLNQSSAAKQVIKSSSREAKQKRQLALELYLQAGEKHGQGEYQTAVELLKQSTVLMFEAIKLATPESRSKKQIVANYIRRRESVLALRDAFNRISDENNEMEDKRKVNHQLDQLTSKADDLLQEGQGAEARIEIDKAYHLLKVTIDSIRSGQTLVRSLQFDSKKDEYLYEIDRNDTYGMLINLLIDKKKETDTMQRKIADFIAEANRYRQQAEAYAGDEAFEQAIQLLELSTSRLVRAMRVAGIFIPG